MTQFDLRTALKQTSPNLRQELFCHVPGLADNIWTLVTKKRNVDPLVASIQSLPVEQQREVNLQYRSFWALKTKQGLKILHEELVSRRPELVEEWGEQRSPLDKVVWTYLRAREVVEAALVFARTDRFQNRRCWKRWPGVPCGAFDVSDVKIDALRELLIDHHKNECRGEKCEIHHYMRPNGAAYFFAYLPDWPEDFMIFNREGHLKALDVPAAFTILFVFMPTTGAIEMLAPGGEEDLRRLRQRFYQAITQTEVSDEPPSRPAFELDHLLRDGFEFVGHDSNRIESVSVVRLALVSLVERVDVESLSLGLPPGIPWRQVLSRVDALAASVGLARDQLGIEEIVVLVQCVGNGERRGRRFRYRVTPRACDLKSLDDDDLRVIGEECNRSWGIDRG